MSLGELTCPNFNRKRSPWRHLVLRGERLTTRSGNENVKISRHSVPEHMLLASKVVEKGVRISGGNPAKAQKAGRNHLKRKSKTKSRQRLRVSAVRASPVNSPSALNSAAKNGMI